VVQHESRMQQVQSVKPEPGRHMQAGIVVGKASFSLTIDGSHMLQNNI